MASQLHSSLASVFDKEIHELRKSKHQGEPMSQELSGNVLNCYRESLHSSEVINARQLKYCEWCGVLLIRLPGLGTRFCPDCEPMVAIATGRMQ
jgi:hypothetical protein